MQEEEEELDQVKEEEVSQGMEVNKGEIAVNKGEKEVNNEKEVNEGQVVNEHKEVNKDEDMN